MIVDSVEKVVIHFESGDVEEYETARVQLTVTTRLVPDPERPGKEMEVPVKYYTITIPISN